MSIVQTFLPAIDEMRRATNEHITFYRMPYPHEFIQLLERNTYLQLVMQAPRRCGKSTFFLCMICDLFRAWLAVPDRDNCKLVFYRYSQQQRLSGSVETNIMNSYASTRDEKTFSVVVVNVPEEEKIITDADLYLVDEFTRFPRRFLVSLFNALYYTGKPLVAIATPPTPDAIWYVPHAHSVDVGNRTYRPISYGCLFHCVDQFRVHMPPDDDSSE